VLATSIYVSASLYAIALGLILSKPQQTSALFKVVWSTACLLAALHAYLALSDVHHWNHHHAFEHIANETERVLGFRFGYGVYFNYLFVLVWIADVIWLWGSPESYQNRSNRLSSAFHLFLILIMVNGAVVFRDGLPRYLGIVVIAAILAIWWRSKTRS
tara:strand:+ start:655 stop:1131 length:477 start_codon:yes stop_codon:yes gene_type:complete